MSTEYVELGDDTDYVAGTHMSIDSLVYALRRGEPADSICQNFEVLRLEAVYGAIAYSFGRKGEVVRCGEA